MTRIGKIIILAGGGILIIVLLILILGLRSQDVDPGRVGAGEIHIWGVVDKNKNISNFHTTLTNLTGANIKYRQFSEEEYEEILIDALAANEGPDIFVIHNTWLARHANKMMPVPQQFIEEGFISLRMFQELFVDTVVQDLILEDNIYALPFYIDTLGLFYNRDLFNAVGVVAPPKTWDEFAQIVPRMTLIDEGGNILRSGAAIGTADNIEFAPEILQLLMMQGGAKMYDELTKRAVFGESVLINNKSFQPGLKALEFYADFSNPQKATYSWNDSQLNSFEAFTRGHVAMMFDFAQAITEVKSKSPQLRFSVAEVPQVSDSGTKIAHPSYWAFAVNRWSPKAADAWRLLIVAATSDVINEYLEDTGRISARRDILREQLNDPILGSFAEQALFARSWFQIDKESIDGVFRNMINSVITGQRKAKDVVRTAADQVTALIRKHQQ
jgi:multiple sugar transport system substrate-binding protein